MNAIELSFWQNTEAEFFACLQRFSDELPTAGNAESLRIAVRRQWLRALQQTAQLLFDQWAIRGTIEYDNPKRIATAHNKLMGQLHGPKLREKILELPELKKE